MHMHGRLAYSLAFERGEKLSIVVVGGLDTHIDQLDSATPTQDYGSKLRIDATQTLRRRRKRMARRGRAGSQIVRKNR